MDGGLFTCASCLQARARTVHRKSRGQAVNSLERQNNSSRPESTTASVPCDWTHPTPTLSGGHLGIRSQMIISQS